MDHNQEGHNAVEVIRFLYGNGNPLYTKTIIHGLHNQIKYNRPGNLTFVGQGIDEGYYPLIPRGEVFTNESLFAIEYRSIQDMLRGNRAYAAQLYCSLGVKSVPRPLHVASPRDSFFIGSAKLGDIYREWEASLMCDSLVSQLYSLDKSIPILKIVAFDCGSFTSPPDAQSSKAQFYKHGMLMALSNHLDVTCYVQDETYNDTDRAILRNMDLEVLDDPDGFLEIDHSTLVVSIAPKRPIRQIVCELEYPAALLCDAVENYDSMDLSRAFGPDPESPRVQQWIRDHYLRLNFPLDTNKPDFENSFQRLAFYARKP